MVVDQDGTTGERYLVQALDAVSESSPLVQTCCLVTESKANQLGNSSYLIITKVNQH